MKSEKREKVTLYQPNATQAKHTCTAQAHTAFCLCPPCNLDYVHQFNSARTCPVFFFLSLTQSTRRFGRAGVECYCQHESGAAVIQLQFLINEVCCSLFDLSDGWVFPLPPFLHKLAKFLIVKKKFIGPNFSTCNTSVNPPKPVHLDLICLLHFFRDKKRKKKQNLNYICEMCPL